MDSVWSGMRSARYQRLDRDVAVADHRKAISLAVQPRTLILENVGFEYQSGQPVLQGISAVIKPGQSVAFVGSSGVGKSTLLNLLPRFYDPTGGIIKLDEWDLRLVKLKDIRRHIALTLQDSVILPTTALTQEWLSMARGLGLGQRDFATVFDVLAGLSGLAPSPDR